ncbi:hypothetical protein [Candidatus Poriferisodalis sp.]|uniref:hypothetical protein n=1 Tax=Candidatus Poriferisodalis sp. TaxID=3101277 RepID=UPI003B5ACFA4
MHPIEHLRYVARAGDLSQEILVRETASALGALSSDPLELVTVCRRILDKYPIAGALWSMAARVCASAQPYRAAREFASELRADATGDHAADALPADAAVCLLGWPDVAADGLGRRSDVTVRVIDAYGEGAGLARQLAGRGCDVTDVPLAGMAAACSTADVILVEAAAAGPHSVIAASGTHAAAAVGYVSGVQVWCAIGMGRALPQQFFEAAASTVADEPWECDEEIVPLGLFSHVVGPRGIELAAGWQRADCPLAAELLRPAI